MNKYNLKVIFFSYNNILPLILIICFCLLNKSCATKYQPRETIYGWPRPSAIEVFDINLTNDSSTKKLSDVNNKLVNILKSCGYEYNYYIIPGGFAMVCRLEQFNNDGTTKDESERWEIEVQPLKYFKPKAYLKALLLANYGSYRVLVFTISNEPVLLNADIYDRDYFIDLWNLGNTGLTDKIESILVTKNYKISVLIYEFSQIGDDEADVNSFKLNIPGRFTCRQHLNKVNQLDDNSNLYELIEEFSLW